MCHTLFFCRWSYGVVLWEIETAGKFRTEPKLLRQGRRVKLGAVKTSKGDVSSVGLSRKLHRKRRFSRCGEPKQFAEVRLYVQNKASIR